MSADPGDLANLADLALPPAISFWPPAAGVWIVGGAVVAALAVAGWRALRRYRADAYLRRAAAEIDAAAQGGDAAGAVSAVLKRAAMVAYGRERVASLTGSSWATFLRETAPAGMPLDRFVARPDAVFAANEGAPAQDRAALLAEARAWLQGQHGRVSGRR
ncbi:DUF4381 domain-containing protein [Bosea sp. RAF48]|uniref:DUF4381 domain-containing protein n=1 Tax=Bosea sp. RAF48 TaxID=3237480 RepID=UPI003F928761